ncbi:hypothetical protein AB0L65_16380 [Nonomuraea sp. NPDC052116]|uniref:hypothetical protein n=1 Tax=Nonomuraea sp. NPDC052116 TaxID=3155665 RepID=UPI003412934A
MRRLTTVAALAIGWTLAVTASASAAQGWVTLWFSDGRAYALENPAEGCHPVDSAVRAYNNTNSVVMLFPEGDCQGPRFYMSPGAVDWLPFTAASIYVYQ